MLSLFTRATSTGLRYFSSKSNALIPRSPASLLPYTARFNAKWPLNPYSFFRRVQQQDAEIPANVFQQLNQRQREMMEAEQARQDIFILNP